MKKGDIKYRFLRESELKLVSLLLDFCKSPYRISQPLSECLVFDLDDGSMGSFEFFHDGNYAREFEKPLIQAETYDTDGRKIMLELSVDNHGYLYQFDSWTADFNPLVSPLGTISVLENINIK